MCCHIQVILTPGSLDHVFYSGVVCVLNTHTHTHNCYFSLFVFEVVLLGFLFTSGKKNGQTKTQV